MSEKCNVFSFILLFSTVFPAGFLQPPLYDRTFPRLVQYQYFAVSNTVRTGMGGGRGPRCQRILSYVKIFTKPDILATFCVIAPRDQSLPAQPISTRKSQSKRKSPQIFAHLAKKIGRFMSDTAWTAKRQFQTSFKKWLWSRRNFSENKDKQCIQRN